jgi:PST family polysaccharide transporter
MASILAGLISAKLCALWVGPSGVGLLALCQGLLGMAGLALSLGVNAGLVRFGSRAHADESARQLRTLELAAWIIAGAGSVLAIALMVPFQSEIARLFLGHHAPRFAVLFVCIAAIFTLFVGVQSGIFNATQRVRALVEYTVVTVIIGTLVELAVIRLGGVAAVPAAVACTCGAGFAISRLVNVRHRLPLNVGISWRDVRLQLAQLVRFGAPYTLSMAAGTGVMLALPAVVLHRLGASEVGFYQAAAAMGVTYLGFLLTAIGLEYFPRVSAAAASRRRVNEVVNGELRLVLLLATPVILAAIALAPAVVPLLYSAHFHPAAQILEWQLLGDIFRLVSWIAGFAILARSRSLVFALVEAVGGCLMLGSTWVGISTAGLPGIGLGYLAAYVLYAVVVWAVAARDFGLRMSPANLGLLGACCLALASLRIAPLVAPGRVAGLIGLLLVAGFSLYAMRTLGRDAGFAGRLQKGPAAAGIR